MESLFRMLDEPSPCGYLPDQHWSLERDFVRTLSAPEYLALMLDGWRRFGRMLFRPACAACQACRALRICVDRFRPNRSQRRCWTANQGALELRIGEPSLDRTKLRLYDRYHAFQAEHKGWPDHPPKSAEGYLGSFVDQPFPVEEWCYYLDGRLVGVGYVDPLESAPAELAGQRVEGLSAIYFFYDPRERDRGLGTWNVLSQIEEARRRGLPFVYLGYFVEGCASMEYKQRFEPNEIREADGRWRPYRG